MGAMGIPWFTMFNGFFMITCILRTLYHSHTISYISLTVWFYAVFLTCCIAFSSVMCQVTTTMSSWQWGYLDLLCSMDSLWSRVHYVHCTVVTLYHIFQFSDVPRDYNDVFLAMGIPWFTMFNGFSVITCTLRTLYRSHTISYISVQWCATWLQRCLLGNGSARSKSSGSRLQRDRPFVTSAGRSIRISHLFDGEGVLTVTPVGRVIFAHLWPCLLFGRQVRDLVRDDVESDLTFAGFVIISCPLKSDSRTAIREVMHSSHMVRMSSRGCPPVNARWFLPVFAFYLEIYFFCLVS